MFSSPSVQPQRSPEADFLLKDAVSCTWLLGTSLVTVTASICDRASDMVVAAAATQQQLRPGGDSRRRHQSEFAVSKRWPALLAQVVTLE